MLKDNSKETVTTAWNGFKGGELARRDRRT